MSEIPILRVLGTADLVTSDTQYSIESNADIQLVCKYLRAYETGGEKGIDKLFKEGTIPVLTWLSVHYECKNSSLQALEARSCPMW